MQAEIHKIKQVQINNLKVKLLRLKNPYHPPKKELLTLGSLSNSFPVPEYLFSPVTKTYPLSDIPRACFAFCSTIKIATFFFSLSKYDQITHPLL